MGVPSGTPAVVGTATPAKPSVVHEHYFAAMREYKAKQYEQAAASFAAVEAECLPQLVVYFVQAKTRRAACFLARARWAEALAIFDELSAARETLAAFDRELLDPELSDSSLVDEIATIYWSRCVCLEQLGRLREACARGAELIERVGTGTTPKQRSYVAGLYLLQAKYAVTRKQFNKAFKALDATIAQCSTTDTPDAKRTLREAEEMRRDLQARVRIHRPPTGM